MGKQPLLVYDAASLVGAITIQFAKLSSLHPVISVAGSGIPFVESLIDKSKGDAIIDYRNDEAVITKIKSAMKTVSCAETPLRYYFDAISKNGLYKNNKEKKKCKKIKLKRVYSR
jgi:NADPH2:quinone reductase